VNCGLIQGYPFSLLLLNNFINELAVYFESFDLGIDRGGYIYILLYTDDIVLLANAESDL
jgi:hypothetical protein